MVSPVLSNHELNTSVEVTPGYNIVYLPEQLLLIRIFFYAPKRQEREVSFNSPKESLEFKI